MNGVNKVFVLGNLGADPEVRYTANGTAVMRLRVASNERVKKNDVWEDHVEWHTVTVFGKRAEGLAKFLAKGSGVHVEGKLRTRKYQDRDGNDRQSTEIIADEVTAVGGRPDGGQQRPPQRPQPPRQAPPRQTPAEDPSFDYGANDPMAKFTTDDDDFPEGF